MNNFSKKKSVIVDEKNPLFRMPLHRSVIPKITTRKEFEMNSIINNISNEIKQKLIEGKKPEQISIKHKSNLNEIISFILDKNALYMNYLLILNQYLYLFPFLDIFSLPECFINKTELFNNIALILKKEKMRTDKIIYLNGQLGKKFYIILEGKVSILEPIDFYIKGSYQQFYQYLDFLLANGEYELIRLCFTSNPKNINEKVPYFKDKFYKYNELLDRNLNADAKQEFIEDKLYIEKFDSFINQIFGENNILNETQKNILEELERREIEEEKKLKEKEEREEEEEYRREDRENEEKDKNRKITGNDEINDKYEILDKIRRLKRESISNFYKDRLNKRKKDRDKLFKLWKYSHKTTILKTGEYFAENSLVKNDNKIKSTIISKTDGLFCILEREQYRNIINEFMEKARKINVDSLMHSKLFFNYNPDLFKIHYFSFFTPIKKLKGDYLFKQKEERKSVYFIKSGNVQIEYFSSWKELEHILSIITNFNRKIKNSFNDKIIPNAKYDSYINKKQKFNIFMYTNGEIVGTNEILYPNTNIFIFDCVCLSDCEIFELNLEALKNIIFERLIRKNYNELNIIKKEKIIERLIALKSNIICQFNRMVHSEHKQLTAEKNMKKNNSLLITKTRNLISSKNKLFISTTDLTKEIINFSPKKSKTKKDFQLLRLKKIDSLTSRNNTAENDNNSFNSKNKKNGLKLLEGKNISTEYLKTERIDNKKKYRRKLLVNFSLKGKVPKLLLNNANTVNIVIDQLILKEKDLFNVNNSSQSKKNSWKFINHLDILSFDKYMNKIESNFKVNKEENSKEIRKKINKIKLSSVPLKKNKHNKY